MTDETNSPTGTNFEELRKGLPEGPWHYRPNKHDDWGVVRGRPDDVGFSAVIAVARVNYEITNETLAEHRANKTDPCESVGRAIAAIPDMLTEIERRRRNEETLTAALRRQAAIIARFVSHKWQLMEFLDSHPQEAIRQKAAEFDRQFKMENAS